MMPRFLERWGRDSTGWWLGLTAACAYFPGIWWGLPHASSEFGKHGWDVDGIGGILTLAELHNLFFEAKPDWYVAYPPFHYLLLGAVYLPYLGWLWLTGSFSEPSSSYPYGFTNPVLAVATLAFLSRLITLLMACGTVVAAYLTGRIVWNRLTGVLAAMAVMLAHPMFYYSRTSNLDVPVLFWLALSLWVAAKMLTRGASIRRGAALGTFIALAIATKDQAYGPWALGCLALPALYYRQTVRAGQPWSWRPWLVVAVATAGVYAIAGGVVLSPHRFVAHLQFLAEFKHASPIVQQLPEILRPLTLEGVLLLARENAEALVEAVGPVIPLISIAGFILFRRTAFVLFAASTALGFIVFVLVPVQHVQYRYVMFLAYVMAFPAARTLAWCFERSSVLRMLTIGMGLLAGVHMVARGVDLTYQMIFDARRDAGVWLAARATPGTRLTYFGLIDQLPPLPAGTQVSQTPAVASVESRWSAEPPDYVVVIPDFSSTPGMERSRFLPESVYERLRDGSLGFERAARFRTRPLFGRPFRYLPYVNSPVEIYARVPERLSLAVPLRARHLPGVAGPDGLREMRGSVGGRRASPYSSQTFPDDPRQETRPVPNNP